VTIIGKDTMRFVFIAACGLMLLGTRDAAAAQDPWTHIWSDSAAGRALAAPLFDASVAALPDPAPQTPAPRVAAVEYSDAYKTRAKIHKYASFATLPLFGTEVAISQSLYSNATDGKRSAHIALGAALGGLFAVNTVTGVWNMWDARKDPNGRKRRLVHGLLMLAADAGFALTPAVAPNRDSLDYFNQRSTHRAVALTSIGIATAGYLTMIIGGR
jgi:hypothetical protein